MFKVRKILKNVMYNEGSFEYRIIDDKDKIILQDLNSEYIAKKICKLLNQGDDDLETILENMKGAK